MLPPIESIPSISVSPHTGSQYLPAECTESAVSRAFFRFSYRHYLPSQRIPARRHIPAWRMLHRRFRARKQDQEHCAAAAEENDNRRSALPGLPIRAWRTPAACRRAGSLRRRAASVSARAMPVLPQTRSSVSRNGSEIVHASALSASPAAAGTASSHKTAAGRFPAHRPPAPRRG